ncbi:MAG: exodeoxyribonuclease III [Bacteroidetes bacterium]|nr:MAG: exodeoxyribonuclease III [Bacteroidota bacterium]
MISYNINGIRAALKKGFSNWLISVNPDIVCLQEIKALKQDVSLEVFRRQGFSHVYWNAADKKGYSGTAVLSKIPAEYYNCCFSNSVTDNEGRVQVLRFNDFTLVNTYFPSGSSSEARQKIKLNFLKDFHAIISSIKTSSPLIICGDLNICHQSVDIFDPVRNKEKPGFTKEERQWLSDFLSIHQLEDVFRRYNPERIQYSWWSYITKAKERNAGWRIDYFLAESAFVRTKKPKVKYLQAVNFSDHCPVLLEF